MVWDHVEMWRGFLCNRLDLLLPLITICLTLRSHQTTPLVTASNPLSSLATLVHHTMDIGWCPATVTGQCSHACELRLVCVILANFLFCVYGLLRPGWIRSVTKCSVRFVRRLHETLGAPRLATMTYASDKTHLMCEAHQLAKYALFREERFIVPAIYPCLF